MIRIGPPSGFADADAGLTRLTRADLSNVLAAQNARLRAIAQVYPAERPAQRYRRTFTLRDGWQDIAPTRSADGWQAGIENATAYGDYVMGDDQAQIHRDRWRTVDAIAAAEADATADAIADALDREVAL